VSSPSSSGCGSTGSGGLVSVAALLLLASCRRRIRRRPVAARAPAALALVGTIVLASSVAMGCSKGSSSGSCASGQTACGSACADLTKTTDHCGTCERACSTGFVCVASGCAIDTPNPFLRTVAPAAVGVGSQVTLQLSADGLRDGAKVRVTGAGMDQELDVQNPASAPTVAMSFSGVSTGTAQVRLVNVVNGNRFISNAVPIAIVDALVLGGVSPGSVHQDQAPLSLSLSGVGFVQGATATLKAPNGAVLPLDTAFVNSTQLTVTSVSPGSLTLGAYDLTVVNPGNVATNSWKFNVTEGAPQLTSILHNCFAVNAQLDESATGAYFYPSSQMLVSGNAIVDSVLPGGKTECLLGTDEIGRCKNGQLHVTADLSGVPSGTYDVQVVNPGSPAALRSGTLQVKVGICP
jgi:hypothetical protein